MERDIILNKENAGGGRTQWLEAVTPSDNTNKKCTRYDLDSHISFLSLYINPTKSQILINSISVNISLQIKFLSALCESSYG